MRRVLLIAAAASVLAACVPDGQPPGLQCPSGRDYARMDSAQVEGHLARGCNHVCPSASGKSARRFMRRLDVGELSRLKSRGCPLTRAAERRLAVP